MPVFTSPRDPIEHDLKIWPCFWERIRSGIKLWELRYNDRGFLVGDILNLREWDPDKEPPQYTGRAIFAKVTSMMIAEDNGLGTQALKPGYCIMGIKVLKIWDLKGIEENKS